ncbi:hypothetical protein TWF730_009189 [Orbilia blumenaviensis]|uniref:Uncharacterized protein n=1 Tax=Orbilia blumenaviensis TaxID=1796055 RepID=A0AAV9UZW8_9PEZI
MKSAGLFVFLFAHFAVFANATPFPQAPPSKPSEPDVGKLKERYSSEQRQVYLRNGDFPGGEDAQYTLERSMAKARWTFFLSEIQAQPGGEGNFRWIEPTAPPDETAEFFRNVQKAEVFCYAQAHSAIEGNPLDPMIFCDPKTGYSIHLHTTRDDTMRVRCSDAARIAWEWARANRGQPHEGPRPEVEQVDPIPSYPGREWQTLGQSFWSQDPSWIVYIGKEDCTSQDPRIFWPGYDRPPGTELVRNPPEGTIPF